MNWRDNYRAQFYPIRREPADPIEEYVRAKLPHSTGAEMNSAVELLSREWPERYPPRASHILDAIVQVRKDKSRPKRDDRERVLMDRMKGETPAQRWETVCEPNEWGMKDWDCDDVCSRLERHAVSLGTEDCPGLERPPPVDLVAGMNTLICIEDGDDWDERKKRAHEQAKGGGK